MDVTSPTASTNTTTATSATSTKKATSDYDTFLKMLTTQMQNQDPLNPIDSADYAVQLATFSGVEQQTKTNQLLETLASRFDLLGMSELAGWVGNEARADVPVQFTGNPVTIAPEPDARADRAVLVVRNAAGSVVSRDDLVLPARPFDWQGTDMRGALLPDGRYSLSVESYAGETQLGAKAVESFARIDEVRGGEGGTRLLLAGGTEVAASAVTALRTAR
jgi:flagellar basal-body rod modification protein FlgD